MIESTDSHHNSKSNFHLVFFVHPKYLQTESETTCHKYRNFYCYLETLLNCMEFILFVTLLV